MPTQHMTGMRRLAALLMVLALPGLARTPSVPSPEANVEPAPEKAPVEVAAPVVVGADDPSARNSEKLPRASKSLLLDTAATSAGFFAVGERGHILGSADARSWNQLAAPTRSTLTAVAAIDKSLWVGGHDGVILHSADAGVTWVAQRRDPYGRESGLADRDPRQGAPVLDIHFSDARNGIAVGAYSLMLTTSDGGSTWTPMRAIAASAPTADAAAPMQGDIFSQEDLMLDDESDPHFNAITSAGGSVLVVVGERGTLLRSADNGASWNKIGFPYKGSMFGVLHLGSGRLLAFGLRGNVYESADQGGSWQKVATQGNVSLMGGSALANGGAVLVGANGTVLRRNAAGQPFVAQTFKNSNGETPALAGVVSAGDGALVLVGDKGVNLFPLK